jgi:RNA polymerase sigma-70 factor (ECF subfamily)
MSFLRHQAVRHRVAPFLKLESASQADSVKADEEFDAAELRQRFERALELLPPRTREAFVLSRGEGLSYTEVALRMGISPKTVGVHIGKSLAVMRNAMLSISGIVTLLAKHF